MAAQIRFTVVKDETDSAQRVLPDEFTFNDEIAVATRVKYTTGEELIEQQFFGQAPRQLTAGEENTDIVVEGHYTTSNLPSVLPIHPPHARDGAVGRTPLENLYLFRQFNLRGTLSNSRIKGDMYLIRHIEEEETYMNVSRGSVVEFRVHFRKDAG